MKHDDIPVDISILLDRLKAENANLKETIERVGRVWALWVCEGCDINGNPIDDIDEALNISKQQKIVWLDEAEKDRAS